MSRFLIALYICFTIAMFGIAIQLYDLRTRIEKLEHKVEQLEQVPQSYSNPMFERRLFLHG